MPGIGNTFCRARQDSTRSRRLRAATGPRVRHARTARGRAGFGRQPVRAYVTTPNQVRAHALFSNPKAPSALKTKCVHTLCFRTQGALRAKNKVCTHALFSNPKARSAPKTTVYTRQCRSVSGSGDRNHSGKQASSLIGAERRCPHRGAGGASARESRVRIRTPVCGCTGLLRCEIQHQRSQVNGIGTHALFSEPQGPLRAENKVRAHASQAHARVTFARHAAGGVRRNSACPARTRSSSSPGACQPAVLAKCRIKSTQTHMRNGRQPVAIR